MKRNFYALALLALTAVGATAQTVWDLSPTGLPNRNITDYIHAPTADVCAATVRDSANTTANPVSVLKVVVTADRGASWAVKNITNAAGLTSSSIWAKDANTIFVPMYNGAGGGKLMRTTDGGNTWSSAAPLAYTNAAAFPNIVAFTDAMTGITMGDPVGNYFEIHRTTDGGNTWTRIPQASIAPIVSGEYGLTDVYTVKGNHIWFGTNKGRVYHSADAGLTWTAASTHYQALAYNISGIAMQDATTGYAFSNGGAAANPTDDLAKTTDGGATWTTVSATGIGFTGRGDLEFMEGTQSTYFVSGSSQCKISTDGGTTWTATTETAGNTSFGNMTFPTANVGFASSNYYTGPVAIWDSSPQACMTILSATQTGNPEICGIDSISFWVRADITGDPSFATSLRVQVQGDNGVWSPAQILDLTGNVAPTFTPDGGVGNIGTLFTTVGLSNDFRANFNEKTRWRVLMVPTNCPADTVTGAAYTDIYLRIANDPADTPPYVGCAVTETVGNTISVNTTACSGPNNILTYTTIAYFLDGNTTTPIQGSSYTVTSGTHSVVFAVNNGITGCFQFVSGSISFVGTESKENEQNGRLFPNPVTDRVNISGATVQAVSARVFDVNGRMVANQNVTIDGNVTTVATQNFAAGVYFLQTLDAQGNTIGRYRFVKQ
jgi:photosystem II stability/assembly factor-like uncharacterized protein